MQASPHFPPGIVAKQRKVVPCQGFAHPSNNDCRQRQTLLEGCAGMVDFAESLLPRICPGGIKTLGRIAAGIPLEALTDDQQDDLLTLLTRPGRYALRVCGDALIEAGIFDGDTLVVQSQQHAQNGDIVVALIDNEQVTINRIRFTRPGQVQLLSDNDNTENLSLDKSRVAIQGKVVAQIRLYP